MTRLGTGTPPVSRGWRPMAEGTWCGALHGAHADSDPLFLEGAT